MKTLAIIIVVAVIILLGLLVWCYGSRMRISTAEIDKEIAKLNAGSDPTKSQKIIGLNKIKGFVSSLVEDKASIGYNDYKIFTWKYDEYTYDVVRAADATVIDKVVGKATALNRLVLAIV